jgi:hypothetical protein
MQKLGVNRVSVNKELSFTQIFTLNPDFSIFGILKKNVTESCTQLN